MIYQILEQLPQDLELAETPAEYWILNCFFITIKYGNNLYLPLTYPIYKVDNKTGYIEGGVWTPPYAAYRIKPSIQRYRTPKKILSVINNSLVENQITLDEHIEYFFYHLGVPDYELKKICYFTEYKSSFSEGQKIKCYHIINWLVTGLDKTGVVNIADPECMRNMHYLDLSIDIDHLPHRTGELFPTYNGKQIVSNLFEILNHYRNVFFDEKAQNILATQYIEHNYEGIIFSYDLNSSGAIRETIENSFMSLNQDGEDISDDFLSRLLMVFTEVLLKNNIHQYRLEGDGFIAAIPKQDYSIHGIKSDSLSLNCIRQLADEIDKKIKEILSATNFKISSKTAVIHGIYKYGKIGSINSKTPIFSGKTMVILSRLRIALENWCKASSQNQVSVLGINSGMDFSIDCDIKLVEEIQMTIKEQTLNIEVYQ